MRAVAAIAALILAGCGPGPEFNLGPGMTVEEMERRATFAFVGVIERQMFESQPFFRLSGDDANCWKVLRRDVRVETVVKGTEFRKRFPVYEIFQICGASGDWNSTDNQQRYLFLVR